MGGRVEQAVGNEEREIGEMFPLSVCQPDGLQGAGHDLSPHIVHLGPGQVLKAEEGQLAVIQPEEELPVDCACKVVMVYKSTMHCWESSLMQMKLADSLKTACPLNVNFIKFTFLCTG